MTILYIYLFIMACTALSEKTVGYSSPKYQTQADKTVGYSSPKYQTQAELKTKYPYRPNLFFILRILEVLDPLEERLDKENYGKNECLTLLLQGLDALKKTEDMLKKMPGDDLLVSNLVNTLKGLERFEQCLQYQLNVNDPEIKHLDKHDLQLLLNTLTEMEPNEDKLLLTTLHPTSEIDDAVQDTDRSYKKYLPSSYQAPPGSDHSHEQMKMTDHFHTEGSDHAEDHRYDTMNEAGSEGYSEMSAMPSDYDRNSNGYSGSSNGYSGSRYEQDAPYKKSKHNYDSYAPAHKYAPVAYCLEEAESLWSDPSNRANYDGRTLTFKLIPKPIVVHNAAEYDAVFDVWDKIATWKGTTINGMQIVQNGLDYVTFEVDWAGSTSKLNGKVLPKGASTTFHHFNCHTNTEQVWGDFGGLLTFFGAYTPPPK